ncbi:MAG TPA: FG-GAP-like repeat-containing protein [Thermoanaerobaculia bacterium]|jgi:hypothetical protein
MKTWSRVWFAMLLLLFPVSGAFAGMAHRVDSDAFRPLNEPRAKGARLSVDVFLGEQPLTLELERFEVFNPDAEIRVYGDNDKVIERLAPPAQQYYRGYLANDPDSMVFLSAANGRYEGLILTEKRRYEITSAPRSRVGTNAVRPGEADIFVMESPLDEDFSGLDGFTCDVEKTNRAMGKFGGLLKSLDKNQQTDGALSASANTAWQLNLALETDYELYVNAGSNATNVNTFIGNLVAAASVIYKRDLKTELFVSHLGVHTTVSDPFTMVPGNPMDALLELGDRWANVNTRPFSGARSSTILISGKSQQAGIAWVGTICEPDFAYNGHFGGAYAYCGGIDPPEGNTVPNPEANPNNVAPSTNYWPLLQFTHELGHNVGSNHTHCTTLSAQDQATYGRTFVDQCYNGEAANPNVTCSGLPQTIPAEKGTIMSYCHLNGASQTRFIFGKTGEASAMMLPMMQGFISGKTPTLSLITAPSSVNSGVATNASVTNNGSTYQWTIVNGTINGSSTSSTVNFTGTTSPVTLKVKATNASGCSVTDFVNITVNVVQSCTYAIAPTSTRTNNRARTGQTIAVTAGTGCNWTAVSNSAFITITGGASGSGHGTVTYSLSANGTGLTRAGTMTIAGHTYTVTQTALAASAHTDFNMDGLADLVWRSSISSVTTLWRMNGTTVAGTITLPSEPSTPAGSIWSVAGIGDFNSDGTADLLWRSPSTNAVAVALLNANGTLLSSVSHGLAAEWVIQGVGDFSGDGKADILWRNSSTYAAVVWRMNGTAIYEGATIAVPGPQWTINGVGDFNGDGKADILWRNTSTSEAVVWLMNGAAILSANYVASPNAIWTVKGVGDFNGDGMTDIFWVNNSNQTVVWLMNGLSILSSGYSATPPAGWDMQAVGDFNADSRADLMWRNTNTGQNALWFMNGISVGSSSYIATQADTYQNVVGPR